MNPFPQIDRRRFLHGLAAGSALAVLPPPLRASGPAPSSPGPAAPPDYQGPNLILIRFGGGARRLESIDPQHTFAPFLVHELARRGTLFQDMRISQFVPTTLEGAHGKRTQIDTSHGQGTLYLISGKYEKFRDVHHEHPELGFRFLGARFESKVPTVFEQLRKSFEVPDHQTLIVNSEDRGDEEFYNFSNHHLYGANYRSHTLSLRRFKTHLLRRRIAAGEWEGSELERQIEELKKLEALDYRVTEREGQGAEIEAFWEEWRDYYGETGLVNPRGDRLLTELTLRAMKRLRPRLLMVNYTDCDYVHWGYMSHYTRAISIMDEGIRRIVEAAEQDEFYRDNTVFVVVPDCGRDNNPLVAVPCQHHFNSRSAREIFALLVGPGIGRNRVVDAEVNQIQVAATIGRIMRFDTPYAEGGPLEQAFA